MFFNDLKALFRINIARFKTDLFFLILSSFLIPLGILYMLYLNGIHEVSRLKHIIAGNMIISISGISINSLAQWISNLKETKAYEYYAFLRINPFIFVFSILLVYTIIGFPGVISLFFLSWIFTKFIIIPNPLIIVYILLIGFAFSGIGAVIGTSCRRVSTASAISNIVYLGAMFFSPILVERSTLPGLLKITSFIFPQTYATELLLSTFSNIPENNVLISLLVIIICLFVSIFLINKYLNWSKK